MPNHELLDYPQRIERSILVQASPKKVWKHLTNPELMMGWMGDEEMKIEIISDWKVESPFILKGFHHQQFENKGKILQLEPEHIFQYEYLSSLSNLEDVSENYTTISFHLSPRENHTELTIAAENFPTFEIYKHLEFYWNGTVYLLKKAIENSTPNVY